MMLSSEEICRKIETTTPPEDALIVVPRPDLVAVRKRNGVSLDVRLGRWFINFKATQRPSIPLAKFHTGTSGAEYAKKTLSGGRDEDKAAPRFQETSHREHFVRFGDAFTIHPGRFVLAATLEWIKLPQGLSAQILGKSSLGRHGLVIETASGVHPGFTGCLTLEIANLGEVPLLLYPGMEIAQLFFYHVNGGGAGNKGTMSGSRKPSVPRVKSDPILNALQDDPD